MRDIPNAPEVWLPDGVKTRRPEDLEPHPQAFRRHSPEKVEGLAAAIREQGFVFPVIVRGSQILDGHARWRAAMELGLREIPVVEVDHLDDPGALKLMLRAHFAPLDVEVDDAELARVVQEAVERYGAEPGELFLRDEDIARLLGEAGVAPPPDERPERAPNGALAARFGVPPFSVLDARSGWWRERKRAWIDLGIRSELGRSEGLLFDAKRSESLVHRVITSTAPTTSVFDPVLCELAYRWFCPAGGVVLDPFAGGSVRGVVASRLGRQYVGIDLRREQVEANREQAEELCGDPVPVWHCGDSRDIPAILGDLRADFVFSCPPYFDLEQYSDDPRDLSNAEPEEFADAYREIIGHCVERLKDDRFACFVVGEVRDRRGHIRGLVQLTIDAFEAAGAAFYNDAILVTTAGSLPLRVTRQFAATRKLGRTHQYVLVFVKGDPKRATEACGECEFGEVEDAESAEAGNE